MKRNFKALGLALAAVFALSAVVASAASAHYVLTPAQSPSFITGEQIEHKEGNKFEITSRGTKVTCTGAHFEAGTVSGLELSQVTVTPSYSGCEAFGQPATVDVNGCDYLLTGETGPNGHGTVHVICSGTNKIEITIPSISCTLKVHTQTPTGGGLVYTNTSGSPDDIHATATLTGVTYEREGNGLACAIGAPSEGNDLDLIENITIKAYKDESGTKGSQINLTVD
jgi:hypothetical protein